MLCLGALQFVGVKYEAKAMLVLLPPGASVPKAGNPYLNLGSMQPVVGVLSDSMLSQQTAQAVREVSPTASYTVAPDPATSGAVLIIDVKDTTSSGAANVMKLLAALAPQQLNELQSAANTPSPGHITTDLVAQDSKPVASHKSQQRAALLVAALGVALTVLAAAFTDGFAGRRSRRRAARPGGRRRGKGKGKGKGHDSLTPPAVPRDSETAAVDDLIGATSDASSSRIALDPDDEPALSGLDAPHLSSRS
ncbi:hypothetical protein GCM10027572_36340 [Flexivirga lutea]